MKRHAPATARNAEPIAAVLEQTLPHAGTVLEVASGTGEHALFFARRFPALTWQPSDPDAGALASIAAYRAEAKLANIDVPVFLDVAAPSWPVEAADAIVCINMTHISEWEATEGLFAGAARILPAEGPLVIYGPFIEAGLDTAPSNLAFDQSLKTRDSRWGLRDIAAIDALGARHGLTRVARREMPANNLTLVYRAG